MRSYKEIIDSDKLYRSSFVVDYFGISLRTLYRWIQEGRISCIKLKGNGRILIKGSEIISFIGTDEKKKNR